MDDLERALGDVLSDDRLDLRIRPGALAAIHAGVQRRRRQRAVVTAVGAAAAVAGSIVAATLLGGAGPVAPQPARPQPFAPAYDVPWAALPLPKPWSPAVIATPLPTLKAPPCRADQLRAGKPTGNGATGHLFTIVPLRNISRSACKLIGSPHRVVAIEPGRPDVVGSRGLSLGPSGVGGDLRPGHGGYLTLETDRDCPARNATPGTFPTRVYHSVAVTLPSGSTMTIPVRLDVECGLHNGGLGVSLPAPRQLPDPRHVLEVSLSAPHTIRSGSTLVYVVTLTNPTEGTVPLRHCPGYVETATLPDGGQLKRAYGLNCATASAIGPGGQLRYEMRLDVPAGTPAGELTLGWQLGLVTTTPPPRVTLRVVA